MVLDVLMPVVDGVTVCRRLRESGDRTPVLMLTARDAVSDRVAGLDAGADDYLTKPFALEELLARVRALLRRSHPEHEGPVGVGDLELDVRTRQVTRAGRAVELTRTEFALLELLMRNARTVLTRDTIRERVWGFDDSYGSNTLDVYIGYLRRKLEEGGETRVIHTVRGVGFVLREEWRCAPGSHSRPASRSCSRWWRCRSPCTSWCGPICMTRSTTRSATARCPSKISHMTR